MIGRHLRKYQRIMAQPYSEPDPTSAPRQEADLAPIRARIQALEASESSSTLIDAAAIVDSLAIGETLSLEANGQGGWLIRHRRNEYSLDAVAAAPYRNRWGTAQEIAEDLEAFLTTGNLPGPCRPPAWKEQAR